MRSSMLLPSSPRLLLALGAVALALVGSTGVRAEALSSPSIDLAKDTGSSLMKRTFHGGYNYCVPGNGLKMAFYNGGCSCKSKCGSHETECADPTNGHGQGACSSKGCTIVCDQGYSLSGRKCLPVACPANEERDRSGNCVCIQGCSRHPSKGCQPQCKNNETWKNNKCICENPFAINFKGECVKPPKCDSFEIWNGKDCVCQPSCGKNKKNKCEPQCPSNSYWNNSKCQCYEGFKSSGDKCIPKCGDNSEWCDKTNRCKCKDGLESFFGVCKPSCPGKNEHYNPISKKCECVPGCLRGKKNICEPEPPKCPKPNEIYDPVSKKCICKPGCKWFNDKCEPTGPSQKPKPQSPSRPNFGFGSHGHLPGWTHKHHTREENKLFCPDNLTACPISQTMGGYECVDTAEELENCGGCAALEEGKDCTQIPGVSGVGCNAGKCVVFSCQDSHRLSASGECVASL